jgi:hypothetical protein
MSLKTENSGIKKDIISIEDIENELSRPIEGLNSIGLVKSRFS